LHVDRTLEGDVLYQDALQPSSREEAFRGRDRSRYRFRIQERIQQKTAAAFGVHEVL
jgi:hypothetical protein